MAFKPNARRQEKILKLSKRLFCRSDNGCLCGRPEAKSFLSTVIFFWTSSGWLPITSRLDYNISTIGITTVKKRNMQKD